MRRMNKVVAVAILATVASLSTPSAFAGVLVSSNAKAGILIEDRSSAGVLISSRTSIIVSSFFQMLSMGYILGG